MNFDIIHISQSGMSESELYRGLSSEGIRAAEVKTGVLLYLSRKERWPLRCNHRSAELAACIHAAGGYVVHHTGDTILAEWVEENVQMSDTISHVLQCAFTTLKVEKLRTLSAGEFTKITIGDKFCAVIGPAVEEIRSIEAWLQHGDIILCPEAWRQCDRQNLTVENIENEEAVKVRCSTEQQSISVDDLHHYNTDIHMTKNPITYLITHEEREAFIRRLMIQTACIKIQANQQREAPNPGLPEVWPTTIMFVYLQFVLTQTDLRFGRQEVSETIAEQMFRCRGKICNVFFFEEGCMFVCAVGLPGDKRQDKTAQAVQAAFRIHETCHQQIDSVSSISIGVATGRVKYKFEQSPLRECCRVYGEKVHDAAVLSWSNPGVVSCDEPTRHYSLLPLSTFRPLKWALFVLEPGLSSSEMDSRRLAFANKQTMLDEEWEVVKCASVIGHFNDNNFNFELLKITLPCMNEPELIIHLRSLFRAGVFKCASEPRNVSSTKTCYCENSCEEYIWFSMDPVWMCRQMSFCNKDVMEIVYMDVKKCDWRFRLIHKYWAQFLEEKAYRCSKCGARSFLFGEEVATDDNNEQLQEIYKAIQHYEVFRSQGIRSRNQACPSEGNGNDTENFLAKVKSVLTEARDRTTAGSCECAQLMETVLIPRMRHWRLAGDVPRTFHYLLESAAACVYLQNDDGALEYLTETRSILENLKEGKPAFPSAYPENAQIGELQPAFMHRLTGEIRFKAGKILEAEESFKNALKILNCKLPRSSVAQSFKLIYEKLKKLHYRSKQFQIPEKRKLDRLQECINCLSFLWKIDCMRGRLRSASLAITMEINLAIQSTDPFKILYSANDYLKYSQFIGENSECKRLEAFLCRTCAGLSDHPEGRRLISHLTRTLVVVKMCTGDLEQSIECTIRAQQLGEVQNRPGLDMRTTAALHLPLLLTDRYSESVQQIQTLSREMSSSIDKGWFNAACMNFLLYAGFVFRPFEECLAFLEESRSDANLEADKSLMLHLYSAVALWYARLENWEMFAVFFDNAYKVYTRIPTSIESISGGVILLECSILLFRKELTDCNRQRRITLKKSQKLFTDFTQRFGKSHIFGPRVLHLNAYLHQLTGRETLAQDLFKEALVLCEEQGNLLEQNWIRQSQVHKLKHEYPHAVHQLPFTITQEKCLKTDCHRVLVNLYSLVNLVSSLVG
ncbi:adenylate cyclase type 10-like isoform X3 [Ictalurus furcatus]|uniref:adenylate cyclase type 10-like isoform X3 n=1 Tax=Ictalurus furcatus TaxID=66913 RepID=UPI002350D053|nr:adenylate cyclase type 10-like isoform X3 [Ictalurus furcatus]